MRVIAGSAKGTRLGAVPPGVRPLSDRAREGLFSSLGPDVVGARVLDLWAGTGALGIEALSRGADHAVFVDRSRAAARTILANLERTRLADRGEVVTSEALAFVTRDDNSLAGMTLVLADPPYDSPSGAIEEVLEGVSRAALGDGWACVLTRPAKDPNIVIPVHWRTSRRLAYGDSAVLIFREA